MAAGSSFIFFVFQKVIKDFEMVSFVIPYSYQQFLKSLIIGFLSRPIIGIGNFLLNLENNH